MILSFYADATTAADFTKSICFVFLFFCRSRTLLLSAQRRHAGRINTANIPTGGCCRGRTQTHTDPNPAERSRCGKRGEDRAAMATNYARNKSRSKSWGFHILKSKQSNKCRGWFGCGLGDTYRETPRCSSSALCLTWPGSGQITRCGTLQPRREPEGRGRPPHRWDSILHRLHIRCFTNN